MPHARMLVAGALAVLAVGLAPGIASARSYTIKPGDSLSAIAARNGTTTETLLELNPQITNRDHVVDGWRITLPEPGTVSAEKVNVTHTVVRAETLSQIAGRYNVTVAELAKANGISNPNIVRVGASLTVPVTIFGPANLPSRIRRSPERVTLLPHFESAAREFGVPSDLLMSMAYMESGWQKHVVSSSGAVGIGQLMPGTAALVSERLGDATLDSRDPVDNIRMSAYYLKYLLDKYAGNSDKALMAYFQGWGALNQHGPSKAGSHYASVIQNQRALFR